MPYQISWHYPYKKLVFVTFLHTILFFFIFRYAIVGLWERAAVFWIMPGLGVWQETRI